MLLLLLLVVVVDTLVGPLGRCVGASDHALFVCLFNGCVLNCVHFINVTFTFAIIMRL